MIPAAMRIRTIPIGIFMKRSMMLRVSCAMVAEISV